MQYFLGRFRLRLPWWVYLLSVICAILVYCCLTDRALVFTPCQWEQSFLGPIHLDDLVGQTENDSELVVRRSHITGEVLFYIDTKTGHCTSYKISEIASPDEIASSNDDLKWHVVSSQGKWLAYVVHDEKGWFIAVRDLATRQSQLRIPIPSLTEVKKEAKVSLELTASSDGKRLSFTLPVDDQFSTHFVWSIETKQPLTQFLLNRNDSFLRKGADGLWSYARRSLMHNVPDGRISPLPSLPKYFNDHEYWISPDGTSVIAVGCMNQGPPSYLPVSYRCYELIPGASEPKWLWEEPLLQGGFSISWWFPFGRTEADAQHLLESLPSQSKLILRHLPTGDKKELGGWSESLHWTMDAIILGSAGNSAKNYRVAPLSRLGHVVVSDDRQKMLGYQRLKTGYKECWDWLVTLFGGTPSLYVDLGYRYDVSLFNLTTNTELAQFLRTSTEPVFAMTRKGDGFAVIETDNIGNTPSITSSITWYSLPLQPVRLNIKPWGFILGAFLAPIFLALVFKKLQRWRKRRVPVSVPPHP